MKRVTKIKDNITSKEYKHLSSYLKVDDSIRTSRRERLLKLFTILHLFGIRVNEATQLTNNMIKELVETKCLKLVAHKQSKEKLIHVSDKGVKLLNKVFDIQSNDNLLFTSERGNKNEPLSVNSVIRDVNSYLKKVFPNKNITSHSFRQTLITELAQKNVNTKIIQELIGHKDISSTYRYIKPSQADITSSLELIR